jgi:hypothetical protein
MTLSAVIFGILALVAAYSVLLFHLEVKASKKRKKIAENTRLKKRRH